MKNNKSILVVLACMLICVTEGYADAATTTDSVAPTTTLTNPDGSNYDDFGAAVALSDDGTVLVIGAPETTATTVSGNPAQVGRAYLFVRSDSRFSQQPTRAFNDPDAQQLDEFGAKLALSGDGSTVLIAASGGSTGTPRVYVFSRSGSAPTGTLYDPDGGGSCFGQSLALSRNGSIALVGADCATVNGLGWVGKAYVFVRKNGNWSPTPVAVLTEPTPAENDFFATSVALSADGTAALVGSDDYSSANPIGHAYVFTTSGGTWNSTPARVFTDPCSVPGSMFGSTVALSADGASALIGTGNECNGKDAYLFQKSGTGWANAGSFDAPVARTGSGFVNTVQLSADGRTALIGRLTGTGMAQIFVRNADGTWSPQASQDLDDPADADGDDYGWSAAISADGGHWIIGSPYAIARTNPSGSLFSSIPGPGLAYAYAKSATGSAIDKTAQSAGAGAISFLVILGLMAMLALRVGDSNSHQR